MKIRCQDPFRGARQADGGVRAIPHRMSYSLLDSVYGLSCFNWGKIDEPEVTE